MREVFLAARAEAQIVDALAYTLERFGTRKHDEYRALIADGLSALAADAESGKRRPEIHPDAWTYHIAQSGKRARHLLLYRIRDGWRLPAFCTTAWTCPVAGRLLGRVVVEEFDEVVEQLVADLVRPADAGAVLSTLQAFWPPALADARRWRAGWYARAHQGFGFKWLAVP